MVLSLCPRRGTIHRAPLFASLFCHPEPATAGGICFSPKPFNLPTCFGAPPRHTPVPLLRENPPADWRLPLIQHPAGSHPLRTEGGPTDEENEPGSCKQRHRTNPRTLRGCAHTKTRDG